MILKYLINMYLSNVSPYLEHYAEFWFVIILKTKVISLNILVFFLNARFKLISIQ